MASPRITLAGALLAALTAAGCGGTPDAPPAEIVLVATGDTVVTPYGDISAAAWMGDNRWVAVAPQEPAVGVADFSRHTLTSFTTATRELAQPFFLFRAGDSVYIADWQKRRLTGWSRSGTLGSTQPAADALRGALPRGRDSHGRWYFELRPVPGPDGSGNRDSAAIVRASADLARRDTIGRLAPPELVEVISDGRRRFERRLLSGQDRWGLLPTGEIWIARVSENRVDWRSDDKTQRGVQLTDRVLPVTDNDRDLFLKKFDQSLQATVSQTPFAVVKPPFEDALTDAAGRAWLVKSRVIGDSVRNYQVVDHSGRLTATVTHDGFGRIIALSDSLAIVAEPFDAGTRLLLYRIPSPASR